MRSERGGEHGFKKQEERRRDWKKKRKEKKSKKRKLNFPLFAKTFRLGVEFWVRREPGGMKGVAEEGSLEAFDSVNPIELCSSRAGTTM